MQRQASILWFALSACSAAAAGDSAYQMQVRVTSDPGVGLGGVTLQRSDTALAVTDQSGSARLRLLGKEGDRVEVAARCPETHVAPAPQQIVLRSYVDKTAPELEIRCTPRRRSLAVVVIAKNGPELPLLHRGQQLAKTDAQGVAHFVLDGAPSDAFEVTLDTTARSDLRPQNPFKRFVIETRDSAAEFDPELSVVKPRVRHATQRPVELPDRPQRIR
jgi:hypothetical protein